MTWLQNSDKLRKPPMFYYIGRRANVGPSASHTHRLGAGVGWEALAETGDQASVLFDIQIPDHRSPLNR